MPESNKQVIVAIEKTENIDIKRLKPIQGETKKLSKENRKKLTTEILETGFSFALTVWATGKEIFVIDGHQRLSCLKSLRRNGYDVPPITCNFISAKNLKEAKAKVFQAISQYGKLNDQGFKDFIADDFSMPELDERFDFPDFKLDFEKPKTEMKNFSDSDNDQPEVDAEKNPYEVKAGDLFKIGRHYVLCGSSSEKKNYAAIKKHIDPDFIFTDPPYEFSVKEVLAPIELTEAQHAAIICTFKQAAGLYNSDWFFRFDFVFDGVLPKSFRNKNQPYFVHQNGVYLTRREIDGIFHCDGAKGIRSENGYWSTIIHAPRNINDKNQFGKNVKGIAEVLCGFEYTAVYDPFLGSGSTIVASERLNKPACGIEIEVPKVNQVLARLEELLNEKPLLIE